MVHALWIERISADVRTEQQAALLAQAVGAQVEWPSLADRLEAFEDSLEAEPTYVDPEELELRDALGLRRPVG